MKLGSKTSCSGPTLRNRQNLQDMRDALPAPRGALHILSLLDAIALLKSDHLSGSVSSSFAQRDLLISYIVFV